MDVLSILLIIYILTKTTTATFNTVCQDDVATLRCPIPDGTWKYKKHKNDTETRPLTDRWHGTNRVSSYSPQDFHGLTTVDKNNTLRISPFKRKHDGIYICKSNTPVLYHVIAVQCKAEACIGDQVTLECGTFQSTETIRELSWHVDSIKALLANGSLDVTHQKGKFDWLSLSGNIPAALKVHVVSPYVQRFTCKTYGMPDGVTPRRSNVTLYPKYCATNVTVMDNSRVKLKCPYYGMQGHYPYVTQFTWTKESRNVGYDERVRSTQGNLIIDPVSHQDRGTYTCSVRKLDGEVLVSHGVTVHVTQSTKVDSNASEHGVISNGNRLYVTQSTKVDSNASEHGVISNGNRLSVPWVLVSLIAGYVASLS